jgi:hypothetical protein
MFLEKKQRCILPSQRQVRRRGCFIQETGQGQREIHEGAKQESLKESEIFHGKY